MEHCNTDLVADVPGKASYLLKNPFYVIIIQNVKQDVISRISQLFLPQSFLIMLVTHVFRIIRPLSLLGLCSKLSLGQP